LKTLDDLTYLSQLRKMRRVAQSALVVYGLAEAQLKFIARGENITYRVDVPNDSSERPAYGPYVDGRYLLRIHRSGYQSAESLISELQWLSALRSEAGIAVPEPVPTLEGQLLALVTVPGVPGQQTCSLLRWVKGRLLRRGLRPAHYRALGQLMARMHQQSAVWQPPPGFTRRHWDWEGLFGENAGFMLHAGEVWDLLPSAFQPSFKAVAEEIKLVMDDLGKGVESYGLIHADLILGENVLLNGGEARPIDFDDCGFGYWVYDFATSLCYLQKAKNWTSIQQALFDGYAEVRPLPQQLLYLDLFMAARHVSEILWAIDMAQINPDFREHLDQWIAHAVRHVQYYMEGHG
jgi:Ser/Thr protein kinase RdoA (MazF antagonist)